MFLVFLFWLAISFAPCSAMEENRIDPYLPTVEEYTSKQRTPYCFSRGKSEANTPVQVHCLDGNVTIPDYIDKRLVASHELYKTFDSNDEKSSIRTSLDNMPVSIDADAFMSVAQLVDGHASVKPTYKLLEGLDYFGNPNNLVDVYTPHDFYKVYAELPDNTGEEKEKKKKQDSILHIWQ